MAGGGCGFALSTPSVALDGGGGGLTAPTAGAGDEGGGGALTGVSLSRGVETGVEDTMGGDCNFTGISCSCLVAFASAGVVSGGGPPCISSVGGGGGGGGGGVPREGAGDLTAVALPMAGKLAASNTGAREASRSACKAAGRMPALSLLNGVPYAEIRRS